MCSSFHKCLMFHPPKIPMIPAWLSCHLKTKDTDTKSYLAWPGWPRRCTLTTTLSTCMWDQVLKPCLWLQMLRSMDEGCAKTWEDKDVCALLWSSYRWVPVSTMGFISRHIKEKGSLPERSWCITPTWNRGSDFSTSLQQFYLHFTESEDLR